MPVETFRRALAALEEGRDLTEQEREQVTEAIRRLLAEPLSLRQVEEAMRWLDRRAGFATIFGVGGSFSEEYWGWHSEDTPSHRSRAACLRANMEEYLNEGRPLATLIAAFCYGLMFFVWDIQAQKWWRVSFASLLAAAPDDDLALRRLAVLSPVLAASLPNTARLLTAKLVAGDGDFFLRLGKTIKSGVADRSQRRGVGTLEEVLLGLQPLLAKGQWADAKLFALFQQEGIVSGGRDVDVEWFKVRRQRAKVPLRPKASGRTSGTAADGSPQSASVGRA